MNNPDTFKAVRLRIIPELEQRLHTKHLLEQERDELFWVYKTKILKTPVGS